MYFDGAPRRNLCIPSCWKRDDVSGSARDRNDCINRTPWITEKKLPETVPMDERELLLTLKGKEDVTLDGHHMMLYANIGSTGDPAMV